MKMSGKLISFEGIEGAGKTTQCEILAKKLKKMGKKVVVVREPGGVEVSEQIREVVLSPKNKNVAITTEVLLFQAARAQLYYELVLPSLKAGEFVLMDRTRDSSTVYQGMVRGVGREVIERLNDFSTEKTVPEVTFLLDLKAKIGMERIVKSRKLDRIESEGVALQKKVCRAYLSVAKENKGKRWVVVHAGKSIEEVAEEIWGAVEKRFGFGG